MNPELYDLIIIGAGPAGLTASIYASCFHLKHLVIGKELGGQMANAPDILNYPGFEEITGKELTNRMFEQAKKRGGEIVAQSVTRISKSKIPMSNLPAGEAGQIQNPNDQMMNGYEIETQEGNKYKAKAIILATGMERRKLNIPGETEYTGKGISYCATCQRQDYEGKICAVIGGANAALQAAVELAQAASKVYIIYRGLEFRGDPIWMEEVKKNPRIEIMYQTNITEIIGDREKATGVTISNPQLTSQNNNVILNIDKLFIEIGGVPGTALLAPLGLELDSGGYIKVNNKLETNIPGVFAAGDIAASGLSIEQISTSIGLGARAAASVFAYLKQENAPSLWGQSQIKR